MMCDLQAFPMRSGDRLLQSAAVALKIRNILLFHALYFGSDVKGNFGF